MQVQQKDLSSNMVCIKTLHMFQVKLVDSGHEGRLTEHKPPPWTGTEREEDRDSK